MRVSEIRVNQIRVNQGLGVLCLTNFLMIFFTNFSNLQHSFLFKKENYTKSLVNTSLFNTNFTNTHFQKVPIPHLTTPFEKAQSWMGKNTFNFLLLNDDNMISPIMLGNKNEIA